MGSPSYVRMGVGVGGGGRLGGRGRDAVISQPNSPAHDPPASTTVN